MTKWYGGLKGLVEPINTTGTEAAVNTTTSKGEEKRAKPLISK